MICAGNVPDSTSDATGEVHSPTGKLDESRCVRDQILHDLLLFAKRILGAMHEGSERLSGLYIIFFVISLEVLRYQLWRIQVRCTSATQGR